MSIVWGAALRPKAGQEISGDIYLVHEYQPGRILAAVIDGLGGGVEAERAARAAYDVFLARPQLPLTEMLQQAHTALTATRGAVVGLLRIETAATVATFCGLGNIGIHVVSRQPIHPISRNGILGYRLPSLLEMRYIYDVGDTFVLYSDGIIAKFAQDPAVQLHAAPQVLADQMLDLHGKTTDDATALVLRTVRP